MARILLSLLLSLLMFGCASSRPGGGDLSASSVREDIRERGAAAVLVELRNNDRLWEQMLAGVESGDSSWLEAAALLRRETDASASTELDFAVARALPKSPVGLLNLVKRRAFSLQNICTVPYIEPEAPAVETGHIEAAIEALKSVNDAGLADLRDGCLARMQSFR